MSESMNAENNLDRMQIGDRVLLQREETGVLSEGTVVDIRLVGDRPLAFVAVMGWPVMETCDPATIGYRDNSGRWRSCKHKRGVDAAGQCFDCRDRRLELLGRNLATY